MPFWALAACASGEEGGAGCEPLDGVEFVANEGPGSWERQGRAPVLVELWRTGPHALLRPVSVAVSRTGQLAIADSERGQVLVIEADGTWRGPIGGQGGGPGEIRSPIAVAWASHGELAVADLAGSKISLMDGAGRFHRELAVDSEFLRPAHGAEWFVWLGVQPNGGLLLQPPPWPASEPPVKGARHAAVLRISAAGPPADTLARTFLPMASDGAGVLRPVPGWQVPVAAVGLDGAFAVAGFGGYEIHLHDAAGRVVRQLCRVAPPLPLTGEEREMVAALAPRRWMPLPLRWRIPQPSAPAPVGRLVLANDGQLLVQRERPAPGDELDTRYGVAGAAYDIFDRDGKHLGEVRMPPAARLQAASGDTLWSLQFAGPGQAYIIAHRILLD